MEPLLEVKGLSKRYDDFTLENVSFAVEPGYVVGLIGSNGAGKTTILKSILGLITPDSGTIQLFGQRLEESNAAALKERIGTVFDTCAFLDTMKIRDVGSLGKAAYTSWDETLFNTLCDHFNLEQKKYVKGLSRGMGMKLSLAFALSHHPDLLILDETTAGLDPIARDEVLDILRGFMEDESHAILMATHITTDLEKIADQIICIDSGHIIFALAKDAICDEAGIAHCRTADIELLTQSPLTEQAAIKVLKQGMGIDVLVPDRVSFAHAFPALALERASIEDYMTITLKGESL